MADKKTLKIGVTLDDPQLAKSLAGLRQINQEVEKLAKSLRNLSMPGAGGSGLFGGGNVKGLSTRPGGGAQPSNKKFSLADGLIENAKAFKGMAREGKDASDVLTNAVRRSVTDQERLVTSLGKKLDGINEKYKKWSGLTEQMSGPNKGNWQRMLAGMEEQAVSIKGRMAKESEKLADLKSIAMTGADRKTFVAELKSAFGSALQSIPGGGMIGRLAMGGGMGLAGAGALAGWGLNQAATAADRYIFNPQQYQNEFDAVRAQRAYGRFNQFRGGQLGSQIAGMANMNQDDIEEFNTRGDSSLRYAWSYAGNMLSDPLGIFSNQGRQRLTDATRADRAQKQYEFLETKGQGDPLRSELMSDITGNARGRLNALRSVGLGGSLAGGRTDPMRAFEIATRGEFDFSDQARAVGSLMSGASGFKQAHALSYLTARGQAAQIGGIGESAGIISKFGGSNASDFLRAALVMGGTSGVGTAGTLSSAAAHMMNTAGTGNLNANAIMGTLGYGIGGGDNSRLLAEQNIKGFGAMNTATTGAVDNYQRARNLQLAISSGANNVYSQDALSKMNFTQMASVLGGGKVSGVAGAMGVTEDMVKKQFAGITGSFMERYINDPNAANTQMGRAAAGIRAKGGDMRAFYKGAKNKEEALAGIAAILSGSGLAPDEAAAEGMARQIVGAGSVSATKGRMAGGGGAGGAESKQLQENARIYEEFNDKLKTATDETLRSLEAFAWGVRAATGAFGQIDPREIEQVKLMYSKQQDTSGKSAQYKTMDDARAALANSKIPKATPVEEYRAKMEAAKKKAGVTF